VQGEDVHAVIAVLRSWLVRVVQRDLLDATAALLGVLGARVIDENAPHGLGGDTEELRAVLPLGASLVDEPEVRFVDERRGLQGVIVRFTPHCSGRLAVQLGINDRQQPFARTCVALTPRQQEWGDIGRDVVGRGRCHAVRNAAGVLRPPVK
jgi:hypothetical protein